MTCNSGLCISDKKWMHPYDLITRGMKSSPGVCSAYDHVFS